jgi:hypothetical protein
MVRKNRRAPDAFNLTSMVEKRVWPHKMDMNPLHTPWASLLVQLIPYIMASGALTVSFTTLASKMKNITHTCLIALCKFRDILSSLLKSSQSSFTHDLTRNCPQEPWLVFRRGLFTRPASVKYPYQHFDRTIHAQTRWRYAK